MAADDWGARTRSGILWSGSAFLASKALAFVATVVLARLLSPAEFGVVAAIVVYLTAIELVSDLGMQATVVYEQEEGVTRRVQTAFTINLALVLVLTAVAVLLAPAAADFFDAEGETWLFRLGALNLLIVGLGNIPDGLLLRGMAFRRRAMPLTLRAAVSGGVSITLALTGAGAEALVYGMLAGSAVWTLAVWRVTPLRPTLAFDRQIARSMAGYGVKSSALDGVAVIGGRVDQAVIGSVLGARALGFYTVGGRLPDVLIQSVSSVVSWVAFPALSRRRAEDRQGLAEATLTLVRYQALYALPAAAALATLAAPLVVVVFSDVWREAAGVLAAVAVRGALSAVGFPVGDALKAVGRQGALLTIALVHVPLLVVAVVAVADHGIVAVAWTRAALGVAYIVAVTAVADRIVGGVGFARMADAVAPALVATAGVALGAGAVRLAWDDLSAGPLLAGAAAGLLVGALALRLFAPRTARVLRNQVGAVMPTRA